MRSRSFLIDFFENFAKIKQKMKKKRRFNALYGEFHILSLTRSRFFGILLISMESMMDQTVQTKCFLSALGFERGSRQRRSQS